MNDSPSSDAIQDALETVAQTPTTLPLKRPTPVFVEAILPPEPAEKEVVAPPEAAAESSEVAAIPAEPALTVVEIGAVPDAISPLPAVEFLPPPGVPFQSSLTLQLASAPDAEIRYALNSTDVGADGLLYDPAQKIFLAQNTSVAARTIVGGELGPLTTAKFEIVQPAWQKIEPLDQSDPTPHEIGEQIALEGPWQLAAASVRGKLHAHRGFWREDSLAYGLAPASDGSYAITIVSDGAGSANLSRVGSKLLCSVALEHLKTALMQFAPLAGDNATLISRDLPLLRTVLVEAASLALQRLREEAARRQKPLGDFSSTLLILVRREWNGAQLCAALQAGDGAIALWDEDGTLTSLGEADHGQHSSETRFLTTGGMEVELPARVKFSIRPRLRAALVMSDGIADDFFPEITRFPDLVGQILPLVEADAPGSGAALLEWMRYEKKGSSDDRAMVISWRAATPAAEIEVAADATLDALTNVAPPAQVEAPNLASSPVSATPQATPEPSDEPLQMTSEAPQTAVETPTLQVSGAVKESPEAAENVPEAASPKVLVTSAGAVEDGKVEAGEAAPATPPSGAGAANTGGEMRDGEQ